MNTKVLCIFGTRPEAIKMAPVIKALNESQNIDCIVCVSGQHKEMLNQVLDLFDIIPQYNLELMTGNQTLSWIAANALSGLDAVLKEVMPDIVLVHGDTTTALAASLAAFFNKIPVGHVEAGLRTFNMFSPYPEEMNRQLISKLSKFHFSPTDESKNNLIKEGFKNCDIAVTGNTVIDALLLTLEKINSNPKEKKLILNNINLLVGFNITACKYVLITGHRRENFGDNLKSICEAIIQLAKTNPDIYFVYPVHLNPNIKIPVNKILGNIKNITLIDPQDYIYFLLLMNYSYIILTDSGGVQEEAPSLKKPVLVMRDTTERPEAIAAGTVKLVGSNPEVIVAQVNILLRDECEYMKMVASKNPYGNGVAAKMIVEFINGQNFNYE